MKRFFTALCVFCLTAVFATAEEPTLIERPLSWTIDSIQIVWNIAEQQFENYELRATTDKVKSSSVGNSQISRNTDTTVDTKWRNSSGNVEASISGGIGFSIEKIKKWGLEGSAGFKAGLGHKHEKSTENIQQNEWVKSNKTSSQLTVTEDATMNDQTLKRNRKLLFTVNFMNHSDENLIFAPESKNTIPIYCGDDQLGDAEPINKGFRIPGGTGLTYPCQFVMNLDDSSKTKLLQSMPDIRILKSQIKICHEEYDSTFDAFTQSFKNIPHFIVRLTADGASREWEFKYDKKNKYKLQDVFAVINEDGDWDDDLFELDDDGTILSVAGYPVKPTKDGEAFVLFAWNGEPVTDLKGLKPRKNRILDVILVSRALLESKQNEPLVTLVPFKETLEKWAKDGLFDGKNLEWNIPMNIVVPDDFATIEEAYVNVKEGGVITIRPGKYELAETLVMKRNITFQGSSGQAEDVIIDCSSSDTFVVADNSSFRNLTISCGAENCCAINIFTGLPKFFRCIITSPKGVGMNVKSNPLLESCIIKDCGQCGILGGSGTFNDCEIYGNEGVGIIVDKSSNPTFSKCKIHDGKAIGVHICDNSLSTFNDCEIYGNEGGQFVVETSGNPTVTGCKIYDGKVTGVVVAENGLGTFNDCEIYGNALSGIRVTTSGNPTFSKCKIYDGKEDGVWIFENGLGTFNDCEIYGNELAGISVETSGNPTVTGCKIHDGKDAGVGVAENGLGTFNDCEIYGNEGAGILVETSGNPTITGCKIHDGKTGGVFVWKNGLGKFNDCDICGNTLAGITVKESGNPTVTGCKIHDGKDSGVVVFQEGLGTFNDCEIYGNEADGISVNTSGNPTVTRCKIHDGKNAGVVVVKNGLGTFTDCEIYGNANSGIQVWGAGNPTVTGCKIHDGKSSGVFILNKGMGTFNKNTLSENYWNGKLSNWDILSTAGEVKGSGNTPTIPR